MLHNTTNLVTRIFVRTLFTNESGYLERITLTPAQIQRLNKLLINLTQNRQEHVQRRQDSFNTSVINKLKLFLHKLHIPPQTDH